MAKKKRHDVDEEGKKVSTQPIRVETDYAKMIVEVAEAKGVPQWRVMRDLLGASLPATWKAMQPILKKRRELDAQAQGD